MTDNNDTPSIPIIAHDGTAENDDDEEEPPEDWESPAERIRQRAEEDGRLEEFEQFRQEYIDRNGEEDE